MFSRKRDTISILTAWRKAGWVFANLGQLFENVPTSWPLLLCEVTSKGGKCGLTGGRNTQGEALP